MSISNGPLIVVGLVAAIIAVGSIAARLGDRLQALAPRQLEYRQGYYFFIEAEGNHETEGDAGHVSGSRGYRPCKLLRLSL
jgi:hypothetical protein